MKTQNTNELVDIMFSIIRLMKHEMSYTDNVTHCSVLQIQTLMFVNHHENVSMGDIAEHFRIELPSATSLINKLCDQKFVARNGDPKDRRLVRIGITAEGKTLLDHAIKERRKKLEKMLSYLSDKEQKDMQSILQTLLGKLQNSNEH